MTAARGPLAGLRVLELGGVGPVPFCGMYFADLGAHVVRVERPPADDPVSRSRAKLNLLARGKQSIAMDIRSAQGKQIVLDLVARSEIVIEGFRPGVLERLQLGPRECLKANPALVFGRMTGWGSGGALANVAGHDINYIGLAGLLSTIGTRAQPLPPLNIVGDFAGALYMVTGLLAALTHARASGQGQVVEASILGGSIALMAQLFTIRDHGDWNMQRQSNWMDGGAPFYRTYATSDGCHMAVGAIEPKFYSALLRLLGLERDIDASRQMDRETWEATSACFAAAFATRTRAEWAALAARTDACCTPVLNLDEAREHPHARAAGMFVRVGTRLEPAPQPRFSATPAADPRAAAAPGCDALAVLKEIRRSDAEIEALFSAGVVSRPG